MKLAVGIATIFVLSTIFCGVYYLIKGTQVEEKVLRKKLRRSRNAFAILVLVCVLFMISSEVFAENTGISSGLGFIAAGLSTGLAALGAGLAVSNVGSSAIGAVSEDPAILGKSMIFLGLAEGIAIYGLIISIMILGRI